MRTSFPACAFLLIGTLLVTAGCDDASPGLTPEPAADGLPLAAVTTTTDTVMVFVVWGSSNACGQGAKRLSPYIAPGIAWEWQWSGTSSPRRLADPSPCLQGGALDGSAWPQFALTYHEQTGHAVFMSSGAKGGTRVRVREGLDWNPSSEGELYYSGLQAVEEAMATASEQFPESTVVFGGVLWIQGNDLGDIDAGDQAEVWAEYRQALHDLLTKFDNDVIERYGGRFYFVNTPATLNRQATLEDIHAYLRLEEGVCGAYPYCSLVAESLYVLEQRQQCTAHCSRWYEDNVHWGQYALNHIGEQTARAAVPFAPVPPAP